MFIIMFIYEPVKLCSWLSLAIYIHQLTRLLTFRLHPLTVFDKQEKWLSGKIVRIGEEGNAFQFSFPAPYYEKLSEKHGARPLMAK